MKNCDPIPSRVSLDLVVGQLAELLAGWARAERPPEGEPSGLRDGIDAICRGPGNQARPGGDESGPWREALAGLAAWSFGYREEATHLMEALPSEALVSIQNLGASAYEILIRRLLADPAPFAGIAPDDLVSELFLRQSRSRRVFPDDARLRAYLVEALKTLVKDQRKKDSTRTDHEKGAAKRTQDGRVASRDRKNRRRGLAGNGRGTPDATHDTPSDHLMDQESRQRRQKSVAGRCVGESLRFQVTGCLLENGWTPPEIVEALDGDEVRPEAGLDEADRERRRQKRETALRAVGRVLEKITAAILKDYDAPGECPGPTT